MQPVSPTLIDAHCRFMPPTSNKSSRPIAFQVPLRLLPLLIAGCAQMPASPPKAPVAEPASRASEVLTQPIDTGLEVDPVRADRTPVIPPSPLPEEAKGPDLMRPEDALSSPYPAGHEDPQSHSTTTDTPDMAALEPQLPPIETGSVRLPAPPAPPRKLFILQALPAVSALERSIEGLIGQRRYTEAASEIERAIRIQPKNPELWHALALTRFRLGQPEAAEDLAKKSNTLARNDQSLIKENWRLIADTRRKRGDGVGAEQALEKTW